MTLNQIKIYKPGQPGSPGTPGSIYTSSSINQKPNYQSVVPSSGYPSSSYPGSPGINI